MPSKEFQIWLSDTAYVVVDVQMVRGRVVAFVVRLMLIDADRHLNIARFDTAHGVPHRDLLGVQGQVVEKAWVFDEPAERVLTRAIVDFKENYEDYIASYRTRSAK